MREIKFRGLRTDTNEFVYGYYAKLTAAQLGILNVPLAEARICHVIIVEGEFFHVTEKSVGQYVGRTDMNGVEVYERDLISSNLGTNKEAIREVRFDRGCWRMVRIKGNSRLPKSISLHELVGLNFPVIGNIDKNPELLEAK